MHLISDNLADFLLLSQKVVSSPPLTDRRTQDGVGAGVDGVHMILHACAGGGGGKLFDAVAIRLYRNNSKVERGGFRCAPV